MGLETRAESSIDTQVMDDLTRHGASTLSDLSRRLPEIKKTSIEYALRRLVRRQKLEFYNATEATKRARVYFPRG